jgi:hypothetical protein
VSIVRTDTCSPDQPSSSYALTAARQRCCRPNSAVHLRGEPNAGHHGVARVSGLTASALDRERRNGHAGLGRLPQQFSLHRGQAVAAAGFRSLAFSLELALQLRGFGREGAGGFDGPGVCLTQRVKLLLSAFSLLTSSFPALLGFSNAYSNRAQSSNGRWVRHWRDGSSIRPRRRTRGLGDGGSGAPVWLAFFEWALESLVHLPCREAERKKIQT